ncbi:helix-turn-helix domain-containing protein [Butyrivibrio sp. CB08]|uniref:helix-turn-helix domain-containing protein n=1 Tax=Butyrivibrio sp. CB08 TaxID=2364879 RepID=UPI000EAA3C8D|nr:helix-turn-helix domain-containing protein [Butyrivibrio sp. CB08]RKM56122.1 helix-turn-helix domain-containing protein [Butyrivibrio sp. CB08]
MEQEHKKAELGEQIKILKGVREDLNLNRKEFSEYMGIPLRTLEEWEAGRRKMPDYVLRLIAYYTRIEKMLEENGSVTRDEIVRDPLSEGKKCRKK